MMLVRKNDDDHDYHLRVVSYCGNPGTPRFAGRVDDFLEDLYKRVSGGVVTQPPLLFSECRLSRHDGRQAVLIKFQLSPSGAHRFTLDGALANFCESIFKPEAFSAAQSMSLRSILGFSAISGAFKRMWHNALFRQISTEREEFMRRIESGANDEYLPDWALTSTFASFNGVTFLDCMSENTHSNFEDVVKASISNCINISTSILVNLSTQAELANPDKQQERWDISHREFKRHMELIMNTIRHLTVSNNELLYADLCDHLYGAMASAAKTCIANKELLLAYIELHKAAHDSMVANGWRAGIYLGSVYSAFSVTTTTAAVPLSQWCLADAAGWLLLGETPMVQTTTLWFSPLSAAISIGAAAYFGWSRYQDKKKKDLFAKKVDYHRQLRAFVVQAWKISHLTHNLLRLIHNVATDRMSVEFVNDTARSEWSGIITKYNSEVRSSTTPSAQLEPRYIVMFLDEQRRDFERWHEGLLAHEAQIV